MDPENDRMISDHVLRIHRYRNTGEQDGDGNAGFFLDLNVKTITIKLKLVTLYTDQKMNLKITEIIDVCDRK
jgi:DNA replicative helicase MCM subunit Mcm2 (Cdc46/Mcm family)